MTTFLGLAWRELAMLVLAGALGSGPAWAVRSMPFVARLAFAPALGFALSSSLLFTLGTVLSTKVTAWLFLAPLALLSTAYAVRAARRSTESRATTWELAQIGTVVVIVIAAMNTPLAIRDSYGPVGYRVSDAVGYIPLSMAVQEHSYQGVDGIADWDLTARFGKLYENDLQHIGENFFPAAANSIFGWDPTASQTAWVIFLLLMGGLGAFAVARILLAGVVARLLAGVLFAGPVFYALLLNGSAAAIAGMSLLLPFGLFAARALDGGRWRDVLMMGMLAAGVQTAGASIVPVLSLAGGLVLGAWAVGAWRRGQVTRKRTAGTVLRVAAVLVLAVALSPSSFVRNVQLWHNLATTDDYIARLPYHLPADMIAPWLLGTREFFSLPITGDRSVTDWLLGDVLPIGLLVLIGLGVWHNRRLLIFAAAIPGVLVLAQYAQTSRDCAYCAERNLIALAPIAVLLLAGAVAWLWRTPGTGARLAAAVTAAVVLTTSGHASLVVARRAIAGGTMLPADARKVAGALQGKQGPVLLEGLDASQEAPTEMPGLYHMVNVNTDQPLVLDLEHNDHNGLAYLPQGVELPPSSAWRSDYRWVFTRIPGVRTDRTTVSRHGAFALQRRDAKFDVTVVSGVVADREKRDPTGTVFVTPQWSPFEFWIATDSTQRAWLHIELDGPHAADVPVKPPLQRTVRDVEHVALCMPVHGTGAQRRVTVPLDYTAPDATPSGRVFDDYYVPGPGLRLTSMRANATPCAGGS